MELVLGEDNLYDVRIPVSELGQEGLPTAWDRGIDLNAVWAAQNASILAQNASEGWIDPSSPKIARMPREGVAPGLLPFAPLLLAVFCVAYMYFDKLLHSVLLPRFYGSLFSTQDRAQRLTFALHHNALVAFGLVLGFLGVPLLRVLVGEAVLSDPLIVGGRVTFGDWIFVPAIAYCSTYLGELFVRRDQPGLLPRLHHMAVLLVALATIGITGDIERNRSATVSFYIIAVWCLFDLVTELPVHAGLIVWRCARDRARARSLSRLMLGLALWRLAMLLANLGVTVYLLLAAWRKLSTIWTVLAPIAGWLWFYAQLQSAHVLYALSRRLRREHRAAELRSKHGEAYSLDEAEDGGQPSRSGLLFNDPAYAGLTLGTTLLSWTHASGASHGLLSEPSRKHLLVLVGVGLAIGVTVVLVRYFTQDADGAVGLAARSGTAGGDKSDASNFNTHNDAKGADRTKSPHEDKNGGDQSSGVDGHGGVVERSTGLMAAVAEVLRQALDGNTAAADEPTAVMESSAPALGDGSGDGGSISTAQSENEKESATIRRRCADNDEWCKKAIEGGK